MEWVSIKDRLPTEEECKINAGYFLVMRAALHRRAEISCYQAYENALNKYETLSNLDHKWKYGCDMHITHWMPLPPPFPEIEEE